MAIRFGIRRARPHNDDRIHNQYVNARSGPPSLRVPAVLARYGYWKLQGPRYHLTPPEAEG